jgi:hypothetical protein
MRRRRDQGCVARHGKRGEGRQRTVVACVSGRRMRVVLVLARPVGMMVRMAGMLDMRSAWQCDAVDSADLGDRDAAQMCGSRGEHWHGCLEDQRTYSGPQGKA